MLAFTAMPRIRKCHVPGCHLPAFVPYHFCKKHIAHEAEYRKARAKYQHRYVNHQSKKSQWRYNHITRFRNSVKTEQNKFYHSKQWSEFRNIVFKRDYHLCQYCKARGHLKDGNIVDHVLPVEAYPQKMKDLQNMVTCCGSCHYWKTRFEEKYYGTGLHGHKTGNPPITDISLIAELSDKIKNEGTRERL